MNWDNIKNWSLRIIAWIAWAIGIYMIIYS